MSKYGPAGCCWETDMKTLISAVLLLAGCVSALADRQADLVAAWSKQVHSVIKRTACYPQGTQDSGVVRTEFSVGRDGRVLVARVLESSGSGTLDEAALSLLYGSEFPAPPSALPGARFRLEVENLFLRHMEGGKHRTQYCSEGRAAPSTASSE